MLSNKPASSKTGASRHNVLPYISKNNQFKDFAVLRAFTKLQKATLNFVMPARPPICLCVSLSVCSPAWNDSVHTGRIFMNFMFEDFFRKSFEKIEVTLKSEKNSGYFT
jgi:hypothetical protein